MNYAPGPKGSLIWGSLTEFKSDALGFLSDVVRDHGDVVRLRFGPVTAHLINHPDFVDHVLSRNAANYDKATRSATRIAATTGDSLLSANQTAWKRHRGLIQPAFQPSCFDGIEEVIDTLLEPMFVRWKSAEQIDIVDEMMQLIIAAAIKILFSSDIKPKDINDALEIVLADTWRRIEAPFDLSMLSRSLHRSDFSRAVETIDNIVLDLIGKRRTCTDRPDDLLTRLLAAHEDAGDVQLSDQELRDAAVTLLLSGHETTANALSWAFIHASGGFETTDPAGIFAEALRLYPSIWMIERRAIQDDAINGFQIPRGSSVLISPYLLHRHPDFWSKPELFDPSRFSGDRPRARNAYLPFGLGQHRCVGLYLANKIALHVIGEVFARFKLTFNANQSYAAVPGITLRHKEPVMMRVDQVNAG